jgi:antitoxin component of RelBE/YafQ-DinJ toxin-antitoxin module
MDMTFDGDGINRMAAKIVDKVRRDAQPALDRLSATCKGRTVDEVAPKFEAVLSDHGMTMDTAEIERMAAVIARGDRVILQAKAA